LVIGIVLKKELTKNLECTHWQVLWKCPFILRAIHLFITNVYMSLYIYIYMNMRAHCSSSLHVWSSTLYIRVGFKLGTVPKQCCLAKLRVFKNWVWIMKLHWFWITISEHKIQHHNYAHAKIIIIIEITTRFNVSQKYKGNDSTIY
jgi:hypothetical protein